MTNKKPLLGGSGAEVNTALNLPAKEQTRHPGERLLWWLLKANYETWFRTITPGKGANVSRKGADLHSWDLAALEADNRAGASIYFITGEAAQATGKSGAVLDSDVTSCHLLFAEWDDRPIEWQLQAWQELGLPEPSAMVTTGGKSVHCYWVLDAPMDPAEWRVLQSRLIDYCGSDPQCKNPSRLMRLPGFEYIDKKTGKGTGNFAELVQTGEEIYTPARIESCLPAPAAAPAPKAKAAAAQKEQWEPRPEADLIAALGRVPEFHHDQGRRPELLGLTQRLTMEWGLERAHQWMAQHSPAIKDMAGYFTKEPDQISAGSIWPWLNEHYGVELKRSKSSPEPRGKQVQKPATAKGPAPQPGTGNAVRLKTNQVLALLPDLVGSLRLNVRSRDVHTADGILTANDAGHLYLKLSTSSSTWGKEVTADAVAYLANQNRFDPVADYLNATGTALPMAQWQRLDHHLLGIDDPIAAEFLPRYLIGAVARVVEPGCDVRQTPVLVGPQWRGKTALGRILFGDDHFISGIGDMGKDALMRLHTAWGVELAELDGVTRRSDQESLKAFLTETVDSIRRPYDVATVRHPRKFVFWGTSNGAALRDTTGNTRYVTIPIPDKMLPLEWAQRHRNALWARAMEQYKAGVQWNECSDAIRFAIADRNDNFTEQDPWHDRIAQSLKRKDLEQQVPVQVADLLMAVAMPVDRQRGADGQRVRRIAESLGWVMERRRCGDERKRGLWPQGHSDGHNPATTVDPSHSNGSGTAGHKATTKPKELEKREREQQQEHPEQQEQQQREPTFGANVVAPLPTAPNPSGANGSPYGQPYGQPCGQLVPPVSPGYKTTTRASNEQRLKVLRPSADPTGWSDDELLDMVRTLEAAHTRRAASTGIAIPEVA